MKENPDGLVGLANPAAVYCLELGYEYRVVDEPSGQKGICIFPDGSECEAWAFLEGKCGQEYSYCEKCGYSIQTMNDGQDPFSREYAVCVSKEGKRIGSITELMALSEKAIKASIKIEDSAGEKVAKRLSSSSQIPSSFDWRDYQGHDWITPVKDQGRCGSCWAFGTVGLLEAMHNIWQNNPDLDLDLSEEYLVSDCYPAANCCGGPFYSTLQFICSNGVPDEDCFSYTDVTGCTCSDGSCNDDCKYNTGGKCSNVICSDKCPDWQSRLVNIDSSKYLAMTSVNTKEYIATKAPLAVTMGMGIGIGYWDGDIYRCTNDVRTNHIVIITGYDDEGGYWIVKNSYGTGFGDGGYFKVGYGECGIEEETDYHFADEPECDCMIAHNAVLKSDITDCMEGLSIHADNVTIDCDGHLISGTATGIFALDRDSITIKNCTITGFQRGISLYRSSQSTLEGNTLSNNRVGINLFGYPYPQMEYGNRVINNTMNNNWLYGVELFCSSGNFISGNHFSGNQYGVFLSDSSRFNTIWANQFINNDVGAYEGLYANGNWWDLNEVGNHWSDYEGNPGYPSFYEIPGEGDGVDHYPNKAPIPKEFSIAQNFPNPFNPSTTIEYTLPHDAPVSLTIYNILGQKVRTLVNEHQPAGYKRIVWDSKDDEGCEVASGIYFYKIKAGEFTKSKKMMIPK